MVEEIIELGHTKISMFQPLEKIRILTPVSTLREFLQDLSSNPVRAFDICSEMQSDSK